MTQKYHFIGIGGIGMSALARILLDKQIPVSGSDLSVSDNLEQLSRKGADVKRGHLASHISAGDTVVFSSQIETTNPEYQAALSLKCPLLHRSDLLAQLMQQSQALAIAGTHGKTTTSSLLTTVLMEGGIDPTFAVGGMISGFNEGSKDPTFAVGGMLSGLNGKLGSGKYFVAEADESDGTFLKYHPQGAILTNVEPEHLDHYKSEEALKKAFQTFFSQVKNKNWLFYCGDDPVLGALAGEQGISYGFGPKNHLQIKNYRQTGWKSFFDLHFEGHIYRDVELSLVGDHNALNGAAVFGLCLRLGVSETIIRSAFKKFPGVARRCEKKGERHGILFLDDYGHHPTEVEKTISAVKHAVLERRLIVIFQPHRYTRTRDLLQEFSRAFDMADHLFITDIYPAFELPIHGIDSYTLIKAIRSHSTIPCRYLAKERGTEEVAAFLQPHDVVLTLGAGDITRFSTEILKNFSLKKLKMGLIFGGLSCEHEISLRSSRFVSQSLDRQLYDVRYFGIDKEGKWVVGKEAEELLLNQPVVASQNALSVLDPLITRELEECDLFLPILHGTNGEDGTIQGFFEMLGKPYIGPDYRSAAICMDKVLTKKLASLGGVPTPADLTFGFLRWKEHKAACLEEVRQKLKFPVYVKPVHLGSSVGITPVDSNEKLAEAIDYAFRYDHQVMVEEGKMGCRELEFAVLGNSHGFRIDVPAPGEKLAEGHFVDYEKKYGQNSVKTSLEPHLAPDLLEKGRALARKAYEAVGCTGMTRVDFLLDPEGQFWLFEMNSIPGMQKLSLFPKIWNREGIPPEQLLDRLVIMALERDRKQKRHLRCLGS